MGYRDWFYSAERAACFALPGVVMGVPAGNMACYDDFQVIFSGAVFGIRKNSEEKYEH
jgi:hypothetical protein